MRRFTLDVKVMSHPSRARQAARLATSIGAELTLDPRPSAKPSAYRTSLAAWAHPSKRSHRLVIQDDAILCTNFTKTVRRVLQARPDSLVAFYVGSAHPGGYAYTRASRRCERYAPLPVEHFVPTVALAMPMVLARHYAEWASENLEQDYPWDDEALRQWRQAHPALRIDAVATIPSLVQHDSAISSVMRHQHGTRQASCFVADFDPLELDW